MTEVLWDRAVPGVAVLTMSNPQRRNAINLSMSAALARAMDEVAADDTVNAVVITGAAPGFCAGGDLEELRTADESVLRRLYAGFLAVAESPLPTIAAVNGAAVGAGINLALACDVRLAGPTARFDSRFMKIGLHPGGGYTWMVDRAVGRQTSVALTLLGEVFDAAEAERVGLAFRRYDSDAAMMDAAVAMALQIGSSSRELLMTTKATMRLAAGAVSHREAVDVELRAQAMSVSGEAFQRTLAKTRR